MRLQSFRPRITISMEVLPCEDGQEMLGVCKVRTPITSVSDQLSGSVHGNSHFSGSSRTLNRRNRYAKARYNSQYARLPAWRIHSITNPERLYHLLYAQATARPFRKDDYPTL